MDHYYWVLEGETYSDNDKYGQTIGKSGERILICKRQTPDASTIFVFDKFNNKKK